MWILLYILIGLVVLVGVLILIAPKETKLERSTFVNIPPEKAFNQLRSLMIFDKWSPWADRDPNQQRGYRGVDGEVGSVAWWKGNNKVGEGEHEVTKLVPNSYIELKLRFIKPFKATNTAYYKLTPDGNGTKVTWGFHSINKPPFSIFLIFMNMEKGLGEDFQKGLEKYKAYAEQN